ncbi:hypothetical protein FIBSPDRAFT_216003 [Athelia psychrophila]|uniref:Uncharacterized protein n=1 Tax=Athelia psychrophila TaxID=1759441 RepID=A0A166SEG7_9AGAM|nr:hypothetical protein FIBSPDRAFT_216003 [Fibularhizoctonia sp. CBS 109695]
MLKKMVLWRYRVAPLRHKKGCRIGFRRSESLRPAPTIRFKFRRRNVIALYLHSPPSRQLHSVCTYCGPPPPPGEHTYLFEAAHSRHSPGHRNVIWYQPAAELERPELNASHKCFTRARSTFVNLYLSPPGAHRSHCIMPIGISAGALADFIKPRTPLT